MIIGLYFGSFNPIHNGHLIIANHILQHTTLDQIWFVVSPQNPFKQSATLLNEYQRLHLVQQAIEGETKLRASDIEFSLPRPSYTIDTLTYLEEKYSENSFSVIMGSDSYQNIGKWKSGDVLQKDIPSSFTKDRAFRLLKMLHKKQPFSMLPCWTSRLPSSGNWLQMVNPSGIWYPKR